MRRILRHRPSPATAIALAALIIAIGGVAYATIPDSEGVIHGCFNKQSGNLRVVESSSECRTNESAIDWNQQGPPGPPGITQGKLFRDVETAEVSTSSSEPVNLGGPSVTVEVPDGALVGILASTELKACPDGSPVARVIEPTDFPGPGLTPRIGDAHSFDWETHYFTPSSQFSGPRRDISGFAVVYPATPGIRTYTLKYLKGGGGSCPVSFRNRNLWVGVTPVTE